MTCFKEKIWTTKTNNNNDALSYKVGSAWTTRTMISQLKVCIPEHNATQRVVTETCEINQTKLQSKQNHKMRNSEKFYEKHNNIIKKSGDAGLQK